MQKQQWYQAAVCLAFLRAFVPTVYAQESHAPGAGVQARTAMKSGAAGRFGTERGYTGFQNRLEKAVGLTPEQREVVRGLLAQQHEALRTLREGMEPKYASIQGQTDTKIRAVLNPEQQKKLDAFLQQQKQGRKARRQRGS